METSAKNSIEITTISDGNGIVCPECRMTMYEIWAPPPPPRRVVKCLNRDCKLCGKEFKVKEPEVTLILWDPVSLSEAT